MKTPRNQLTMRAVAAAALVLAGSFNSVPALADAGGAGPAPSAPAIPTATVARAAATAATAATAMPPAVPGISDAGLAAAVQRDLGMTVAEFNASGQLGRAAADAVASLRALPGYVGISLRDGTIRIAGNGTELQARVDELNRPHESNSAAAVFQLVPPAAELPAAPAPTAAPAPAPTAAPTAALAPDPADLVAADTEQLFQDYLREVGPAGLQAVAYSGGTFIIRTGGTNAAESALLPAQPAVPVTAAAPGKISPAAFVARYANVHLEQAAPAAVEADVYGGDGYVIDAPPWRTICSAGFGAYTAAGLPAVLTAGHCTEDGSGTVLGLEPRTSSRAGGSAPLPDTLAPFGTFGYSQFGGPGNSWVVNPGWNAGDPGDPGNVGTDIAVVEALSSGITTQPAANTWANAVEPGPTAVKIIGIVAPFAGQDVCRSGRSDGWSCGQVAETGIYVVGGRTTNPADVRAFRGFLSRNVQSSGGDSGGPWISGNYAVGTHSAGETSGENFAIATTLEDSLTKFPTAVELQLFLNKPELVAPENLTFVAGQPITGRVPAEPASAVAANSKVRITQSGQPPVDVAVDAAGHWSFPAPSTPGPLQFAAETVNGFSRSGPAAMTVSVTNLAAPVITSPAEGAALNDLTRIDGTGTPGLTVKIAGGASGSTVVGPDGSWSVPIAGPVAGRITVHAVQTSSGTADSPSATRSFTVAPAAPGFTSISDGSRLSQDSLPATLTGSGIDGAEIGVMIDGIPAGETQVLVAGGRWSTPFPADLSTGEHALSLTQSVDGVASAPLLVAFSIGIDAPAVAPAAPGADPAVPGGAPAAPAGPGADPAVLGAGPSVHGAAPFLPAAAASQPAGTGNLPSTGAGQLLPTAGLAGGAIVLGALLLAATRRRVMR